ncbi:E3 ubiquitin-protein ligase UBR3 [Manis javanica]|nr:E3 ubiquitin-protein ligase UBR3 [Manis javanica]
MQDEEEMIGKLKQEIDLLNRDIDDIEDENEQLKQENKILLKPVKQLTSFGQCRDNIEPKKLPVTEEEQIYPWDTCAAVHDLRLSLLQRYFKDNDQVLQGFSVDKGEFTCPLCRQFADSVLPCYPGGNVENNLWQCPSNKYIQDLIKEVEELQGRPGAFPSETILSKEIEFVIKDIKNTTQKKYRDYIKTPAHQTLIFSLSILLLAFS